MTILRAPDIIPEEAAVLLLSKPRLQELSLRCDYKRVPAMVDFIRAGLVTLIQPPAAVRLLIESFSLTGINVDLDITEDAAWDQCRDDLLELDPEDDSDTWYIKIKGRPEGPLL